RGPCTVLKVPNERVDEGTIRGSERKRYAVVKELVAANCREPRSKDVAPMGDVLPSLMVIADQDDCLIGRGCRNVRRLLLEDLMVQDPSRIVHVVNVLVAAGPRYLSF